jgi:transcriptional regulator with XRE-family HTH domain
MNKETLSQMTPKTRGRRLRMLREKLNVSLRELAEVCGVDFSLISMYENGQRRLTSERCDQLSNGITEILNRRKQEGRFHALLRAQTEDEKARIISELTEAETEVLVRMLETYNVNLETELTKLKVETQARQALVEFFEKRGHLGQESRMALIKRFFVDQKFRDWYTDEYRKFYAAHPEIPHLADEQAAEIRARANERIAERERLLVALQNARTIEEKDARLAAYEALASSVEQSLRQEVEQERKETEMYKSACEQAEADSDD